jgi:glutaredoxin
MSNTIYSATGCARCKITKNYMQEHGISYEEFDFKAEGKDAFNKFYRANRNDIFRDKDGVEFPVFTDGEVIRQGVSVVIGYLLAQDNLAGFIGRSLLHGEWIDGFNVSGGDIAHADELLTTLAFLKKSGLKIQLTSNGKNSKLLEMIIDKGLVDKVIMEVGSSSGQCDPIMSEEIPEEEVVASLKQVIRVSDYQLVTTISPFLRADNTVSYLTQEELGDIAKMIEEETGSKKHPYKICACNLQDHEDERLKEMIPMEPADLFKYRTAARRYMVMTEIEK